MWFTPTMTELPQKSLERAVPNAATAVLPVAMTRDATATITTLSPSLRPLLPLSKAEPPLLMA